MGSEVPDLFPGKSGVHRIGDHVVHVVVSGIGPQRARRATERMCTGFHDFYPDWIMALGFCGGTRDDLDIGHLIVADRVAYRNREIALDGVPFAGAVRASQGMTYHIGQVQMVDWPALSRNRVTAATLAVDMESFAIVDTAQHHHTPVMIVKAVSDIVPRRTSVKNLLNLAPFGAQEAKSQLDAFAKRYFS